MYIFMITVFKLFMYTYKYAVSVLLQKNAQLVKTTLCLSCSSIAVVVNKGTAFFLVLFFLGGWLFGKTYGNIRANIYNIYLYVYTYIL